ncbi:MAG: iron ABC transporter permease [Victivallales bacterium]|nr:iron ABC transporter permease [Victivallales bacterium]
MNTTFNQYKAIIKKKRLILLVSFFVLIITAALSLHIGNYNISFTGYFNFLSHGSSAETARIVIFNIRLPRLIAAIISGGGLALSGLVIQTLLKNPLASPFTIGISQGSAFGAALAIVLLSGAGGLPAFQNTTFWIILFAFLGSVCSTVVILLLAKFKNFNTESVILAGVALSALFSAGTMLLQYFATEDELVSIIFWTFGDVSRSTWKEIILIGIVLIVIYVFFFTNKWNLNSLISGNEIALTLGVNVKRIILTGMLFSALAAALITAFHGIIAFIGLLAPHIAKRIIGTDFNFLLPMSFMTGGILLIAADTLGRVCLGTGAVPVGVLTSFMGAPLFLYLLIKSHK